MATVIRLRRGGAKDQPHYRIVVADSRKPRDGRFIEKIGHYHPLQEGVNYVVDLERADYWLKTGARISETCNSIVRKARRNQRRQEQKTQKKPETSSKK